MIWWLEQVWWFDDWNRCGDLMTGTRCAHLWSGRMKTGGGGATTTTQNRTQYMQAHNMHTYKTYRTLYVTRPNLRWKSFNVVEEKQNQILVKAKQNSKEDTTPLVMNLKICFISSRILLSFFYCPMDETHSFRHFLHSVFWPWEEARTWRKPTDTGKTNREIQTGNLLGAVQATMPPRRSLDQLT